MQGLIPRIILGVWLGGTAAACTCYCIFTLYVRMADDGWELPDSLWLAGGIALMIVLISWIVSGTGAMREALPPHTIAEGDDEAK